MNARASTPAGIGALGFVGDTRTAVLVDQRGDAQWLCLPHFDGEPVFAALVAGEGGGSFLAGPAEAAPVVHRAYRPGTPVLETVWRVDGAELVLTEGLIAQSVRTRSSAHRPGRDPRRRRPRPRGRRVE